MNFVQIIILFAVYSFTGWIIEVLYRSFTRKRFINPGFLFGPFVPVYGVGALLILLIQNYISPMHIVVQFFIYVIVLSIIEYITSEFFELTFNLKLWDYSDTKFNFKGKISLVFSLGWGVLAIGVSHLLHPIISSQISKINPAYSTLFSAGIAAYFLTDTTYSVASLNRFRRDIALLYDKYSALSSVEAQKIIDSFKRILEAFPHLNHYLDLHLTENIRSRVNNVKGKLSDAIESILNEKRAAELEYIHIVEDILNHDVFKQLHNFFHHNSSIYEHAKVVSYVSYKICKILHLDYKSAARGGLLHDFFLYNWRDHDLPDLAKKKYHGMAHPKIALDNSMKHFELNEIEKDIIVKHMWPLTVVPPKYQESFVVSFADKYVSSKEFVDEFKKRRMGKIKRTRKKKKGVTE